MPNFGSDVDGCTVDKTNQQICNSQNKNETNTMNYIHHRKITNSNSYCFLQET